MKSIYSLLILLMLSFSAFGQEVAKPHVVSINTGASVLGFTFRTIDEAFDLQLPGDSIQTNVDLSIQSAFSLSYDFSIDPRFSIGVLYSFQTINGEVNDYLWVNESLDTVRESFNFKLRRNNISALLKYHYTPESEVIDLYSGIRAGMIFWKAKVETSDENFNAFGSLISTRPNASIVLFGFRYYPIESLGLNAEIATGAPYIISAGAQFRF